MSGENCKPSICIECKRLGNICWPCKIERMGREAAHMYYEKMGAEQNQQEWEARAIRAESVLDKERDHLKNVIAHYERMMDLPNPHKAQADDMRECLEAISKFWVNSDGDIGGRAKELASECISKWSKRDWRDG